MNVSETITGPEFLVRTALVVCTAFVGWLVMGLEVVLIWLPLYYALVVIEKLILRKRSLWRPTTTLAVVVGLGFLIATVFSALPVYLWYMDGKIWKMGALVLLSGGVLNIFLLRSRNWQIGIAYVVPVSVAFYAIAFDFFTRPFGNEVFWCAMFLAAAMNLYLFVAVWEANKANAQLRMTREQFHHAQKSEALGTLTGGIAHDFNNLLAVIIGNLELLKSYPEAEDAQEFLEEALASAERGAALTRQLLAYVRRSELKLSPVDPADLLQNVAHMAKRVFEPNIRIELNVNNAGSMVLVDAKLLEAALLNLCINARDAMPQGGTLTLRSTNDLVTGSEALGVEPGEYSRIDVCDTGEGIPEDIMKNVFDPFFTTKGVGRGTGLGLAMVQGFAQQSGGVATIESTVGVGTTVSVLFPANHSSVTNEEIV